MSEPDRKSPETIQVMIYCINGGKGYRVFPDPIIARRGDHLLFHVHGTSATVDMAPKFENDVDGGNKNPTRIIEAYTGDTGKPNESGRYTLIGKGAKSAEEYKVTLDKCGPYKDPLPAAKSRPFATNPSMIIED